MTRGHGSDPFFAVRYQDAREQWLDAAERVSDSSSIWSIAHPLSGPDGKPLATDCAWIGPADATRVIVVISGTHGVEGYVGNAIQRQLLAQLQNGKQRLPKHCALLCLHALTPWGMAWYRRCDEHGIDLNRNFVDFDHPPCNEDYPSVQACLRAGDLQARLAALARLRDALGQRPFEIAVSGGQYDDPQAPFYGGRFASHGRKVVEQLIERHALFARTLHVLDLHSGLGPRGEGELICDHPPGSAGLCASMACFGTQVTSPVEGNSSSVPKFGLLDYTWHAGMNPSSFFLTLEFGTDSTEQLFACLEIDHRYWAEQRPSGFDDRRWSAVRTAMLEHFCPADRHWRSRVLRRAEAVFQQLIAWS